MTMRIDIARIRNCKEASGKNIARRKVIGCTKEEGKTSDDFLDGRADQPRSSTKTGGDARGRELLPRVPGNQIRSPNTDRNFRRRCCSLLLPIAAHVDRAQKVFPLTAGNDIDQLRDSRNLSRSLCVSCISSALLRHSVSFPHRCLL